MEFQGRRAMFNARLSSALSILALGAAIGLAGCAGVGTVQDQIAAADAKLRVTKPMVEWLDVRPEYLAEVDPARLQGEGAALVIGRSLKETLAGDRSGAPDSILLRDVSTSTIRQSSVQRTGTDADVGWAVMIVPPGQYAINRSATIRRTAVNRVTGQVKDSTTDEKGHPFVPLASTIHIGAGDVLYVGTLVRRAGPNVDPNNVEVRDERAAAATWARERVPQFAARLQTRLLPKPVKPLS
jgi:hypothetical protein